MSKSLYNRTNKVKFRSYLFVNIVVSSAYMNLNLKNNSQRGFLNIFSPAKHSYQADIS